MSPKIIENFFRFNNYYLVLDLDNYFELQDKHPLRDCFNNCNQVLLLTEGDLLYKINNNKYNCDKGSLITFQRNRIPKFYNTSKSNGFIILFSNELLKEINHDLFIELNITFSEFAQSSSPILLNNKDYSEMLEIIRILDYDTSQINSFVKNDISTSLTKRILKIIESLKTQNEPILLYREKQLLSEFNKLLSKSLNYSRSVKYYANLLAISTKKLNSITKTYWGITAKEYIEEKIIVDSKKILLETTNTIKQISYTMGFTEPTNFNKFFKKFADTTPLQFREQYNKGTF